MHSICTERLILRPYTNIDLLNLLKLRSDPRIWSFSTFTTDNTVEGAQAKLTSLLEDYANNRRAPYALFNSNQEYIGEAGAFSSSIEHQRVNIGYNLLPQFWGCGFATEITKAIIYSLLIDSSVIRIEATVSEDNLASRKVLEKSDMQLEGILHKYAIIQGKLHNICYYSIVK